MEDNVSISNAEMKVMGKIWEKKEMVTVQDMLDVLNEEGEEWAYQTVATFLKRLEAKNILASTKKGNKLCYYPLVSKEQYEKREARGFVKNKFRGSLKEFLVAFSGSDSMDEKDIKDLKEWLHEFDD